MYQRIRAGVFGSAKEKDWPDTENDQSFESDQGGIGQARITYRRKLPAQLLPSVRPKNLTLTVATSVGTAVADPTPAPPEGGDQGGWWGKINKQVYK